MAHCWATGKLLSSANVRTLPAYTPRHKIPPPSPRYRAREILGKKVSRQCKRNCVLEIAEAGTGTTTDN
jgi:hypothetical protein